MYDMYNFMWLMLYVYFHIKRLYSTVFFLHFTVYYGIWYCVEKHTQAHNQMSGCVCQRAGLFTSGSLHKAL